MYYKYKYNPKLKQFAQANKKSATDAERLLWVHLRARGLRGYKFRRQYPVGNYILDFYCIEKKLAVELDGSQHMQQEAYDKRREIFLKSMGIGVMRFWDNEVLQHVKEVLEKILTEFDKK